MIQSINIHSLIQFLKLRSVVFYVFVAGVFTDKLITIYFKVAFDCAIHLHPYHWGAYSSFHRAFTLPKNADKNGISAKYEEGILELKIGKKEKLEEKAKSISVN